MSAAQPPQTTAGKVKFDYVDVDSLRFDETNPRFAAAGEGKSPQAIQTLLEREPHLALELVESLLENGFIDYEPLVVRPVGQHYVVVEGNRRLAAIRHILANRAKYEARSTRIDDLQSIPVLVFPKANDAATKQEQRVYLGVRHLFGFRQWPAESKARFLDMNIKDREDLERALREMNIKRGDVRRWLIPYRLRKRANKLWVPYKDQDFWLLGEALNRTGVKEFLELDVNTDSLQIESFNEQRLKELLTFIYGAPGDRNQRRISETRDISRLSAVLRSPKALALLRRGEPLETAELYLDSRADSLKRLRRNIDALKVLLQKLLTSRKEDKALRSAFDDFSQAVTRYLKTNV